MWRIFGSLTGSNSSLESLAASISSLESLTASTSSSESECAELLIVYWMENPLKLLSFLHECPQQFVSHLLHLKFSFVY